jgi:hypothetical protein
MGLAAANDWAALPTTPTRPPTYLPTSPPTSCTAPPHLREAGLEFPYFAVVPLPVLTGRLAVRYLQKHRRMPARARIGMKEDRRTLA